MVKAKEGVEPAVSLRPVTFDTVRSILDLKVRRTQRSSVASNAESIAEGHINAGAWFRAIFADERPVGFVMLFDPMARGAIARGPIARDQVGLWRLMIDRRYQGKGYGKGALDLVCAHIRDAGHARELLSSYVPGPHGPERFYLRYGFLKTGRFRNGGKEVEIVLPLVRSD